MITYAERSCFTRAHLYLWGQAVHCVDRVPASWGNDLRCHELARAVCAVLGGPAVIDGKCGPVEHSWLEFTDGTVLDVYTPGRLPAVQIIDPIVAAGVYREGSMRNDIRDEVVAQLITQMREAPNTGIAVPRADGSRG